jgi:hypothetical protein
MWRPAVVRFGMLCILAVACSGGSRTTSSDTTIGNRGPLVTGTAADTTAAYWCSIRSGEFEYPAMPCVIRTVRGELMLEKLAGSQRFRGVVRPRGEGFTFDGEFFCPWGDCTQPLRGVFQPIGEGRLRGTFDDKSIVVTLTRASGVEAFGGSGYGGAAYGGSGYGSFGGFGYGGVRYGGR